LKIEIEEKGDGGRENWGFLEVRRRIRRRPSS
jgi:hypothetical protein